MCGGFDCLGKNAYAERIYSDIPPHWKIKFEMNFWKIDS